MIQLGGLRNSSSMIIDNITGNITQLSDSVILNIDSSDTSSSIDDDVQEEYEEVEDDIHEGLYSLYSSSYVNKKYEHILNFKFSLHFQ